MKKDWRESLTRHDRPWLYVPMNLRFGTSKTVHNANSRTFTREADGTVTQTPVPTCSVATAGKTRHETTDEITCKTCAKKA